MESFGTNVRQKSGLNREILRTGWGQLDQMLSYKCCKVIKVTAAYTSQRCSVCGHTEASNRKTRSKFTCYVLWTCGSCRPECGCKHTGLRDWGCCTARGVRVTDPYDP